MIQSIEYVIKLIYFFFSKNHVKYVLINKVAYLSFFKNINKLNNIRFVTQS